MCAAHHSLKGCARNPVPSSRGGNPKGVPLTCWLEGCASSEAAAAIAGSRLQPAALQASEICEWSGRGSSTMLTTLAACRMLPQCTTGLYAGLQHSIESFNSLQLNEAIAC